MQIIRDGDGNGPDPDRDVPDAPQPTPAPDAGAPTAGVFPITIRLRDVHTGTPIAGALITADWAIPDGALHTTGADGAVTFGAVARPYRFEISALGYEQLVFRVAITGPTTLDPILAGAGPGATPEVPARPTPAPAPGASSRAPLVDTVPAPERADVAIEYEVPLPAPDVPAVVYEDVAGARRISQASLKPPEVGRGGNAYITTVILIISAIRSLFGGRGGEGADARQDRWIKSLGDTVLQLGLDLVNSTFQALDRDARGLDFTKTLLGPIIGGLINGLVTQITRGSAALKRILAPILKWIDRIEKYVRHIYDVWLRPILATIDAFRRFLQLLELFHVKWAATLDAKLQSLERKLTAPILKINEWIKDTSNILDRIITFNGALQRIALIKGLLDNAGEAFNALLHPALTNVSPAKTKALAALDYAHEDPSSYGVGLAASYAHTDSPITSVVEELVPVWRMAAGLQPPIDEPF